MGGRVAVDFERLRRLGDDRFNPFAGGEAVAKIDRIGGRKIIPEETGGNSPLRLVTILLFEGFKGRKAVQRLVRCANLFSLTHGVNP
jgi:hypothetical protein